MRYARYVLVVVFFYVALFGSILLADLPTPTEKTEHMHGDPALTPFAVSVIAVGIVIAYSYPYYRMWKQE